MIQTLSKKLPVYLSILFFAFCAGGVSSKSYAQEPVSIEGMVQIERNHIYMISAGENMGIVKGDIVEIYRLDVKVAEARLISVLSDSSMAEITAFFNVADVFESDTVRFVPRAVAPAVQKTLSSGQDEQPIERVSGDQGLSLDERAKRDRGLLGSDTNVQRQVQLAREPLKKEIEGLTEGIKVLKDDYGDQMNVVLRAAKRTSSDRAALKAEEKWRKKLEDVTDRYKEKLSRQRDILEKDFLNERKNLEQKIESLTKQISIAGKKGDIRTKQLLTDLKGTDAAIDLLKQTFEQERLFDESEWVEKVADLEKRYQNQLRIQQEEFRREFLYSNEKFVDEVDSLKDQIRDLQEDNIAAVGKVQADVQERDERISDLRKSNTVLKEELKGRNKQLVKSKKRVVDLQDELTKVRTSYDKRMEAVRTPLNRKNEELHKKIASVQEMHEEKLRILEEKLRKDIVLLEEKKNRELAEVEARYKTEISSLQDNRTTQITHLQDSLGVSDTKVALLEAEKKDLYEQIEQDKREIQELNFNVQTVSNELADLKIA